MKIKRFALQTGVIAGVILGMKYVFPVMLPFLVGWILAEGVYPLARYMAGRRWSRRLHIKESGFGTFFILLFTVLGVGLLLLGAEYLTGKIGDCVKYYPQIKAEAAELVGQCCQGVERITGIPAAESREYIFRQAGEFQKYLLEDGLSMERAVDSVRSCVVILGVFIIGIVSAILFLQEREKTTKNFTKVQLLPENGKPGKRITGGTERISESPGENHRSDLRAVCGGIMDAENSIFSGTGASSRNIGCITGTGNRDISYTGGDTAPFSGETFIGAGLFLLYVITAGVRQILEPRLVGNHVGLSPLLILLSVYLGLIIYGGFGFILGPLSALLLYGIFREWDLLLA